MSNDENIKIKLKLIINRKLYEMNMITEEMYNYVQNKLNKKI